MDNSDVYHIAMGEFVLVLHLVGYSMTSFQQSFIHATNYNTSGKPIGSKTGSTQPKSLYARSMSACTSLLLMTPRLTRPKCWTRVLRLTMVPRRRSVLHV